MFTRQNLCYSVSYRFRWFLFNESTSSSRCYEPCMLNLSLSSWKAFRGRWCAAEFLRDRNKSVSVFHLCWLRGRFVKQVCSSWLRFYLYEPFHTVSQLHCSRHHVGGCRALLCLPLCDHPAAEVLVSLFKFLLNLPSQQDFYSMNMFQAESRYSSPPADYCLVRKREGER